MIAIASLAFIICCVLPIAYLFVELLRRPPDTLGTALLDARRRGLLFNTAMLGMGTAAVATAIGAPLGILLGRVSIARKPFFRLILAIPALLPPYIVGLAWVYLGAHSEWTFTLPAAVLVLGLSFYPLSMLATETASRRIDGHLEEAALLVAPPERVLRRITLPLVGPGTLAAALLIFVLAISEFGVPGLLRVRVYTTEVFTAFAALYDVTRAVALTLPLLTLCIGVASLAALLAGDRLVATRRTPFLAPPLFDRWRRPGLAFGLAVIAIALVVPVLILAREASRIESVGAILGGSGAAIANSLVLATLGATLVVSVSIWLGYARARAPHSIGRAVDLLFVVLFALPSTVVGVGLIGFWNRPGPLGLVYGTNAMFVIAYLARFIPVAGLMLAASMQFVPTSHEEAASVAGAGWARAMTRVVLPQLRSGVVAAWFVVFVLAFGELGASILVAPPGDATLAIRIYTLIANSPSSHLAAFALLQTMVILAGVTMFSVMAAWRKTA